MLAIIDYDAGNLRSVYSGFRRLGIEAEVTRDLATLRRAEALVLPGQGAFGDCIGNLRAYGLEDTIYAAIQDGVPFLGICVGLQLLFDVSEEMGEHRGLGIIPGRVKRFPEGLTVPHMGWNQIHQRSDTPLWQGIPDGSYAYFVHSYYVAPEDETDVAALTDYGIDFVSAVARDNLFAIQFHPEKSQDVGERILRNFCTHAGMLEAQP